MPSGDSTVELSRRRLLALWGGATGLGLAGGRLYGRFSNGGDCDPTPLTAAPTEWPSPHSDRGNTRSVPAASAPTGPLVERWHRAFEIREDARPVVANGRVFLATGNRAAEVEFVRAYDIRDGRSDWEVRFRNDERSTSPVAMGDSVFHATTTEESGTVVTALAAADGSERWTRAVGERENPTIAAGLVHLTEYVGHDGERVYALDAATGERCWERTLSRSVRGDPAVTGGRLVYNVGTEGELLALDARTGAEAWRGDVSEYFHPNNDAPDSAITDAVRGRIVADADRVLVTTFGGRLLALDAASGDVQWTTTSSRTALVERDGRTHAPAWFTAGALSDGVLLAIESRHLENADAMWAIDTETGATRWRFEPTSPELLSLSLPTIAGQKAYVCEYQRVRGSTRLLRFDLKTGERLGAHDIGEHGASGPVLADETVVVADGGGVTTLRGD
ncbi:PQQ-binding-like beta-propeller repeat protein [Halorussus sp. MSC15.2]|uniref:outer membrane protein assembly factor BamB family protein n=1 Tax=Halorussus sp. MSC15.2 TaxID=2283638 RepID=UPI0013D39AB2|nr:PQQ-binding-like beta-propeller repeat protein [Halorussus sp. MSC15.2]NEU55890.1 PQQ-binding-like beta-propeller repeat protein [Halorussus sp. MSC15.2]